MALKSVALLAVMILIASGVVFYQSAAIRTARMELTAAARHQSEDEAQLAALQQRLAAVEQDNATLRKAEPGSRPDPVNLVTLSTALDAHYKRGQELMAGAQYAGALKELLWCYDANLPVVSPNRSLVLSDLEKLGQLYPGALAALRGRSEQAKKEMLADAQDKERVKDFALLNRALRENERTLELYDQLGANDPRGRILASYSIELMIAKQRYADALVGRPYSGMGSSFGLMVMQLGEPEAEKPERYSQIMRGGVSRTVDNIEVLAGTGDLDHARELVRRLLSLDASEETKVLLQQHLARAGQAELLATPVKP